MQTIVNDSMDGEYHFIEFSAVMKENIYCALFVAFFLVQESDDEKVAFLNVYGLHLNPEIAEVQELLTGEVSLIWFNCVTTVTGSFIYK